MKKLFYIILMIVVAGSIGIGCTATQKQKLEEVKADIQEKLDEIATAYCRADKDIRLGIRAALHKKDIKITITCPGDDPENPIEKPVIDFGKLDTTKIVDLNLSDFPIN